MPPRQQLTQAIKAQALGMGFSLVGVASCDTLPHEGVFAAWLGQNRHGEMAYLGTARSRECRAHPERLLPDCRSVLVLATRYPSPLPLDGQVASNPIVGGKIAAYAWGDDYHEFLPGRLKRLIDFIETGTGQPILNRWYTDTGPILERELAQRAGLGWIGKNTCLIQPEHGSYFLLAEILLGLELEPDSPFTEDRCGTCMRCIQACPTGCILPDRTLDARRCISYLTIELKGSIPAELRRMLDGWVFGCDVCQQVCPWNRFSSSAVDPAYDRPFAQPALDLLQELALTPGEFNRKYRQSPIRRAKRRGYLRNVAVALGNQHDPAALPTLVHALASEPEPLVRAHVAWALGQFADEAAKMALQEEKRHEQDGQVLLEIEDSLANINRGFDAA